MTEVAVIAYGAGNIASVQFALERLGATVRLTDDPAVIAEAELVILPGVGAAGYAMSRLSELGLIEPIRAFPRPLHHATRGPPPPRGEDRMTEVAVIAYGAGNIASVQFALERLGATVRLTDDPAVIAEAERVILPGVGAAGYAMSRLSELGLVEPIRAFPRPLLGVCLGQQLLFETSQEGEGVDLLGFIPGAVSRLEPAGALPVPHMGWSRLTRDRDDPLLEGVGDGAYAYFVHSYVCPDGPATLARADYGGPVPAVVRAANRWGCQFHPERSAEAGATILKNFLGLSC